MGYAREFGEFLGDAGANRTWTALITILFYAWMDITLNISNTPCHLIVADFAGKRQTTASVSNRNAGDRCWNGIGGILARVNLFALFGIWI
jgi:solute carrier family 45, member 1/2/4